MSSVIKALDLLNYFSATQPEIGLSHLCRLAGRDKATTHRHLQALELAGLVEQNSSTKQYRLGPAVLQLAQTREATVPRKSGTERPLRDLATVTGETAHAAVLSGTTLYGLAACESPRHATRAIIDLDRFPLHATASGLCALAFGPTGLMDTALSDFTKFTETTATTPDALQEALAAAHTTGFGRADRSYETEIHSLSAPLFDHAGQCAGAVSVASVATRFTPTLEQTIKQNLVIAARDITHNWGGTVPLTVETLWAKSCPAPQELEPAS